MTKQSRHWQLTDYEVTEPYVIPQYGDYTVGQVERCPDTGKLHWQLYCYTKDLLSVKAFKKRYPIVHFEIARNPKALEDYGQKEETRVAGPFHYGEAPAQGKRTDLDKTIHTACTLGKRKAAEENPGCYAKHYKGIEHVIELLKPIYVPPVLELRDYQRTLLDSFLSHNNPRHVYYLYDECGGSGKSKFAEHIRTQYGGLILGDGRIQDWAYIYNSEPYVIFDLTRAQDKGVPLEVPRFCEYLSNGVLTSTKYESKVKSFKAPQCMIMSNTRCDITTLSSDRWIHVDWTNHGQGSQVPSAFQA
nr:replication associated protein [Lake Sarah-associated circular virus-46]